MQEKDYPPSRRGELITLRMVNFVAAWPLLGVGLWLLTVALLFTGQEPEPLLGKLVRGALAAGGAAVVALAATLLLWAVLVTVPRRWFTVGAPLLIVTSTLGYGLAPSAMPEPLAWPALEGTPSPWFAVACLAGLGSGTGLAVLAWDDQFGRSLTTQHVSALLALLPAIYLIGWIGGLYDASASMLVFLGSLPGGLASCAPRPRHALLVSLATMAASCTVVVLSGFAVDRFGDDPESAVGVTVLVLTIAGGLSSFTYRATRSESAP